MYSNINQHFYYYIALAILGDALASSLGEALNVRKFNASSISYIFEFYFVLFSNSILGSNEF